MYITYEIGIRSKYLKTSLRLIFHVATNNPSLFRLRVGTQYYGFNRITLPVNTFGTLSHTTRGTLINHQPQQAEIKKV